LPLIERAAALMAKHCVAPPDAGDLHETFARVLVATHGDRVRAAELARQAHDDRAQLPDAEEERTTLDAWRTSEGLK